MCHEIPSVRLRKNGAIIESITDCNIEPVVINGETKYRVTIKDKKKESVLTRLMRLISKK